MRMLGAVLVLSISFYMGLALSGQARRRVAELEGFCRLLEALRDGIASLRLPVGEIYDHFSNETLEKNGFLACLRAKTAEDHVWDPLGEAVREMMDKRRLALLPADAAELLALSRDLGKNDSAGEIKRCEYYLARLSHILKTAEKDAPGDARVSRATSLCAGILAVLLLF